MSTIAASDPYKYRWARHIARQNLENRFNVLNEKLNNDPKLTGYSSLDGLLREQKELALNKAGKLPPKPGQLNIGIVGAGCAGLFTAMVFDFLNSKFKEEEFHVDYEILEAANETRLGGRLYTHWFTDDHKKYPHDYYDIGAMRFPENDVMKRTFQLFKYLDLTKENGKLIPYYFYDYDKVCPSYFNDVHLVGPVNDKDDKDRPKVEDPYRVNKDPGEGGSIPKELLEENPGDVIDKAIEGFTTSLEKDMHDEQHHKQHPDPHDPEFEDCAWKHKLMKADFMSTREFLRSKTIDDCLPEGPGYNFNTIEWLETFAYATGWYNQSLSETVLEALDFNTAGNAKENTKFVCIEGGTQQVAQLMADNLKQQHKLHFNRQVTAITAEGNGDITLSVKRSDDNQPTTERTYFAVFNSTTLGALQRMDLSKASLRYGTKQAIRSLGYGASCKVGIRFKRAWWMEEPFNIKIGGIAKTDLPLRVCVYPSYNINDPVCQPTVLLCSYTWAQDAQRIGALISPDSPKNEAELKTLLLRNLAQLHTNDKKPYDVLLEELTDLYDTHHAYDWYADPYMSGAFAYFGPGQFSKMWPEIIQPNGSLYLIGEAASAHHAWIVGALESSVRGVYQMLDMLHNQHQYKPYEEAVEWLKREDVGPFGPLPREIPLRQGGTPRDKPVAQVPVEGKDIAFTTAEILLGLLESVVEAVDIELGEGGKSLSEVLQSPLGQSVGA